MKSLASRYRVVACPQCGAPVGEPCRSGGRFPSSPSAGEPVVGIHVARKRLVRGPAS